jgi:hypothetical protein
MSRLDSSPDERSETHPGLDERLERLDKISSRGSNSTMRRFYGRHDPHVKEERPGDAV